MNDKTFITQITDYIQSHYDLTHNTLSVVFPNKRAALYLRNELKESYKQNIWIPKIQSIQEAMSEWSRIRLADTIELIFKMMDIKQNVYGERVDFVAFASRAAQMLKDFDEIDQYNINAEQLFGELSDAERIKNMDISELSRNEEAYLGFFKTMSDYYTELGTELAKSNCGYYGAITRSLSNLSEKELNSRIPEDNVLFAGFSALTATEEDIIVKLINNGKGSILWNLDKYYFDDKTKEAGIFARKFANAHKDIELLYTNDNLTTSRKEINVIGVSGSVSQAKALQFMLFCDQNAEKQAVVLSDENLLVPVLNSIPDNVKSLQVSMGFPFNKSTIYNFINQLLKLNDRTISNKSGIYYWQFVKLIEQELFKILLDKKSVSELNHWKHLFEKEHRFRIDRNTDFEILKEHTLLYNLLLQCSQTSESAVENIKHILNILETISTEAEKRESYFIDVQITKAKQILTRIKEHAESHNLAIPDIQLLFETLANSQKIDLYSNETGGLQIMGLLETRNINFDTVNILSVNEGILPKDKAADSFIPYDFRRSYNLPTYIEKQAIYANHLYSIIQNTNKINIFYNNLQDDNKEQSRYILQIEHELTKANPNLIFNKLEFAPKSVTTDSEKYISVQKTDSVIEKMYDLYGADKNNKFLSPSALANYRACPLKFYLENVEKINDNSTEEIIQDNELGSIIHKFFELIYKPLLNKPCDKKLFLEATQKDKIEKALDEAIGESFRQGISEIGFNRLVKNVIRKHLRNFISFETESLEKNTMTILGLEDESMKAEIEVAKGKKVLIGGIIDRIDKMGDMVRIIDYKTGKVDKADVTVNSDSLEKIHDKAMQLIIYKYLYLSNHENFPEDNVEMSLISFRRSKDDMKAPLEIESDTELHNNFIDKTEDMLTELISQHIFNREIPFHQTEKENNCRLCRFKTICNKSKKSY